MTESVTAPPVPSLQFDRMRGLGACDQTRLYHHMAEVVLMRPQQFLALTPKLDASSKPRIGTLLKDIWDQTAFCPLTLTLAPEQAYEMGGEWQTRGQWAVLSHDGRHRATAIVAAAREARGKAPLVPVMIFGHSNGEMLPMNRTMIMAANDSLIPQGDLLAVQGPFFHPTFGMPETVAFSGVNAAGPSSAP